MYLTRFAPILCAGMSLAAVLAAHADPAPPAATHADPAPPAAPAKPAAADAKPAAATKPAEPAVPDGMKAFSEVIKGAKELPGLITLYQNDKGAVYFALKPEQLDHDFILSISEASGLGIDGMYSGVQLGDAIVQFHRQLGQVMLIERNLNFRANPNSPEDIAIQRSFTDSTLSSLKIEAIEPEKNLLLVNAAPLFLSDLPDLGSSLTESLGTTYSLDAGRSYLASVKSLPQNVEIEAADTFSSSHPASPAAVPDGRAMAVRVHYSLYPVPADNGYVPRKADTRVGYFVTAYKDLSNDSTRDPFVRYIDRWDLRKLHPDRPLSLPVQPIVFWLDDATPLAYRPAITQGILRWNKAFEKIGIEDAIQVRLRPPDADWDISDARYNVIRWFNADEGAPAIGMHRVNPYTGQTIGATIVINDGFARYWKSYYHDYIARLSNEDLYAPPVNAALSHAAQSLRFQDSSVDACDYAAESMPYFAQAAAASMLLPSTVPDRVPESLVDQYLAEVISHEVGHTLGLRHNFKGSTMLPYASLFDQNITRRLGTSSSVMDYMGPLIALPGQIQGDYYSTTVGPYDDWAIDYGYKPLDAKPGPAEDAALSAIASRSSEPDLQYGTDEDSVSVDPTTATWDYGREPLDGVEHNLALAQVLFSRIPQRLPRPGQSYDDVHAAYGSSLGMYVTAFSTPLRYIGGSYIYRDHAGQPGGRVPVQPIPAATQIRALRILTDRLFNDNALKVPPTLLNEALSDRWSHWDSVGSGPAYQPVSLRSVLLNAQRSALEWLYSPQVLSRLEDQNLYASGSGQRMDVAHVLQGTTWAMWSMLAKPGRADLTALQRDTQRLHLDALIALAGSPPAGTPEDAQAMARFELGWIQQHVRQALARGTTGLAVTAHLQESDARITRALATKLTG